MKLSRTLLAVTALALPLCGSATLAADKAHQDVKKRVDALFRHLDSNQDGRITRAETEAAVAARFATADGDADGQMNQAEIQAMGVARAAQIVADKDRDRNGRLSPEEMDGEWAMRLFEETDEDRDGVITRADVEKVVKRNLMPQN
jgi:hypothetical protein